MITKIDFAQKYLANTFFYEHYKEDFIKFFRNLRFVKINKGSYFEIDEYEGMEFPIFFIFEGFLKFYFKEFPILKLKISTPSVIGETSCIRLLSGRPYKRISKIYALDNLSMFAYDLKNLESEKLEIQLVILEFILKHLWEKIIVMNKLITKINIISEKIILFLNDNKQSMIDFINESQDILKNDIKYEITDIVHTKIFLDNEEDYSVFLDNKDIQKRLNFFKRKVIPNIDSFKNLHENMIFLIAKNGIWLKYNPNESICKQGDINDGYIYIVVKGKVEIIVNNNLVNILKGTFMVGEMAFAGKFSGKILKRTATVKCVEESYVIKIKVENLVKYNEQFKISFQNSLIFQMLKRLESLNETLYEKTLNIIKIIENEENEHIFNEEYGKILVNLLMELEG